MRYVRSNFVYGRTFLHDADLDQQRRHWLEHVANVRVHGTTGERPRDRFVAMSPSCCSRWRRGRAPRWYSTSLPPASGPLRTPRPVVEVERRPLTVYAQLAGGVA